MIDYTLVMASYNRPLLLDRGLRSVRTVYHGRIVVVNDGDPVDDTWKVCEQHGAGYFSTGYGKNISVALNLGMSMVDTEWLVLTCPEILWTKDNHKLISGLAELDPLSLVVPQMIGFEQWDRSIDWLSCSCLMPFFMLINTRLANDTCYDPDFGVGYAFEDNDFTDRLMDQGASYRRVDFGVLHLYHGETLGKCAAWMKNKRLYNQKRALINEPRT